MNICSLWKKKRLYTAFYELLDFFSDALLLMEFVYVQIISARHGHQTLSLDTK